MKRTYGYGSLLGAGALGGAAIVLAVVTLSAISGDTTGKEAATRPAVDVPPTAMAALPGLRTSQSFPGEGAASVQWEDVQLATELAPFEEDRVWTGERYQLPGEEVTFQSIEAPVQQELEPPPAFEVLGTASSRGSGLAVIRVGTGTPVLVAPGQRIEGYEVASIDGGRVTMRNAERSLSLSVASASPTGPVVERDSRQGPNRNQRNSGNRGDRNAQDSRNAPRATQVQTVERFMPGMEAGTRVEVDGNQVIFSIPNGQQQGIMGGPGAAGPAESQMQFRRAMPGVTIQGQPASPGR